MTDVFLSPGLRTPFVKAHGAFAKFDALMLSNAVARAMKEIAEPDMLIWGQVIPSAVVSNIAREMVFEAGLDLETPAFSTVMACASSFMGMVEAAGMVGRGGLHLALVGGVETMSHVSLALKMERADEVYAAAARDPATAANMLTAFDVAAFDLPRGSWANKQSGRSQGQHTEDTAKHFAITRQAQDERALRSHQGAIAGQEAGFFSDLVIAFAEVDHDTIPRRDTTLEKLARP